MKKNKTEKKTKFSRQDMIFLLNTLRGVNHEVVQKAIEKDQAIVVGNDMYIAELLTDLRKKNLKRVLKSVIHSLRTGKTIATISEAIRIAAKENNKD